MEGDAPEKEGEVCIGGHTVRSLPRRERRRPPPCSFDEGVAFCTRESRSEDGKAEEGTGLLETWPEGVVSFDEERAACGTGGADRERGFVYLDHTADVIVHAFAESLSECFAFAGLALFHCMADLREVRPQKQRSVVARGRSAGLLLFHFLDELLFLYGSEYFIACQVRPLEITEQRSGEGVELVAKCVVVGERFDCQRHSGGTEVKAVTLHRLQVLLQRRNAPRPLPSPEKLPVASAAALLEEGAQQQTHREGGKEQDALADGSGRQWLTECDVTGACSLSSLPSLKAERDYRWACYVVLDI